MNYHTKRNQNYRYDWGRSCPRGAESPGCCRKADDEEDRTLNKIAPLFIMQSFLFEIIP